MNGAEGVQTGDAVKYSKAGGTAIGGLADGSTYYAIVQADGSLKLADTRAHALAGTSLDLTSKGSGEQTLEFDRLHTPGESVIEFDPSATDVVDASADTLDLGDDTRGLRTGDQVVYRNGDGANTDIGGLEDGKTYTVTALADGKIQLSKADGSSVDIRRPAAAAATGWSSTARTPSPPPRSPARAAATPASPAPSPSTSASAPPRRASRITRP